MITLYRFLICAIYRLFYPYFRLRAARGEEIWRQRLALDTLPSGIGLWFHAASVGEVRLVWILSSYLIKCQPGLKFHVTVMTEAGMKTARSLLPTGATFSYFPFDCGAPLRRTLDMLGPTTIITLEGELWPNLLLETARRRIPVILVNARMSEKSFRRFRRIGGSIRRLLACYDRIFLRSRQDAEHYRSLGAPAERCHIAGDLKFDAPLTIPAPARIQEIRRSLGAAAEDFLLVAGSTRPGEERILSEIYRRLTAAHPNIRMVLAPRHLERLVDVKKILEEQAIDFSIFEESGEIRPVVLVDRIGVLIDLFAAADIAYVGGTFSNTGGHNILEPVWAGTPVLFGPDTRNIPDAAAYVIAHNYGARARTEEELFGLLLELAEGRRRFTRKTGREEGDSPARLAGEYILDRIRDIDEIPMR